MLSDKLSAYFEVFDIKFLSVCLNLLDQSQLTTKCPGNFFLIYRGSNADEAMENILDKQLPALKTRMESGELKVDNIDVFCEQGVFNVEQTRKILLAGKELGLAINFHGEELHRLNSAEVVIIILLLILNLLTVHYTFHEMVSLRW